MDMVTLGAQEQMGYTGSNGKAGHELRSYWNSLLSDEAVLNVGECNSRTQEQ